jgi:hypothetical protein
VPEKQTHDYVRNGTTTRDMQAVVVYSISALLNQAAS